MRRVGIDKNVVLIVRMVHNAGFVQSLKTAMDIHEVKLPAYPEFVAALGCALLAAEAKH